MRVQLRRHKRREQRTKWQKAKECTTLSVRSFVVWLILLLLVHAFFVLSLFWCICICICILVRFGLVWYFGLSFALYSLLYILVIVPIPVSIKSFLLRCSVRLLVFSFSSGLVRIYSWWEPNKTKAKINGSFVSAFVAWMPEVRVRFESSVVNVYNVHTKRALQKPTNKYQAPIECQVLSTENTSCNFYNKMTHKTLQHTAKTLNRRFLQRFFCCCCSLFLLLFLLFISLQLCLQFFFVFIRIGINFCLGFLVFNDDERGCWWLLPGWIVLRLVLTALLQLSVTVFLLVWTRVVRLASFCISFLFFSFHSFYSGMRMLWWTVRIFKLVRNTHLSQALSQQKKIQTFPTIKITIITITATIYRLQFSFIAVANVQRTKLRHNIR